MGESTQTEIVVVSIILPHTTIQKFKPSSDTQTIHGKREEMKDSDRSFRMKVSQRIKKAKTTTPQEEAL